MTLPYLIQNTEGNWLDADKVMANKHYLEAIARGNFLLNSGFETWGGTTSHSNPADGTDILDQWSLEKGGTSGSTAAVAREGTTKNSGLYAVKVNITGAGSSNSYLRLAQSKANYIQFAGMSVLAGVYVRLGTASKVRLSITDGVATQYSAYHTGGGAFERLAVALSVSSSLTELTVKVEITSDMTDAVYIDSSFLYVVSSQASQAALDALVFTATDDAPGSDVGTTTNDNAQAGHLGEYVESVVPVGSAVAAGADGVWANITSISLTAGDWDVAGHVVFSASAAVRSGDSYMAISAYSANTTTDHVIGDNVIPQTNATSGVRTSVSNPRHRISIASTTTIYLKFMQSYSSGTASTGFGKISARRVR